MVNLKLFTMREKVKEELKHINRGDLYQNMLRHDYFSFRMMSLSEKQDKSKFPDDKNKILRLSIETIRKWAKEQGADFKPDYDKSFFKI